MPGPAPKPAHLRRNKSAPMANTLKLPQGGRPGPPPDWPLTGKPTKAQLEVWEQLWRTPAAVAWERLEWSRAVARYVVVLVKAEKSLTGVLLSEVRQMEDRLGLSPMAMLRLRWEVVQDELAESRAPVQSTGRRLKAVDDAVAGS